MRREFSVSAEAARKTFRGGDYKDLTETRNRARKVSGTLGTQDTFLIQRPFKTVINYVQPHPLPPPLTKEKRTEVAPSLRFSFVEGRVPLHVDKTVITTLLRPCGGHDTSRSRMATLRWKRSKAIFKFSNVF